jgi:predicted PurR-regulated permease PerM
MMFVPYIGAFISAIPSIILAMVISAQTAIDVVGRYFAIHAIEGFMLMPLVQRRATHLPPALGLAGQLVPGISPVRSDCCSRRRCCSR